MKKVWINEEVQSEEEDDDDDVFYMGGDDEDNDDDEGEESFQANKRHEFEARAADQLSSRLLAVNDDSDEEDRIIRKSLRLLAVSEVDQEKYEEDEDSEEDAVIEIISSTSRRMRRSSGSVVFGVELETEPQKRVCSMMLTAVLGITATVAALLFFGYRIVIRPPKQPVGPYKLIELQEGDNFFNYYSFYEGPDSIGSNGYLTYVGREVAEGHKFLNVTYEKDEIDFMYHHDGKEGNATKDEKGKPFIYMGSAPTEAGPRDSIRLEGNRRFNRGLFM